MNIFFRSKLSEEAQNLDPRQSVLVSRGSGKYEDYDETVQEEIPETKNKKSKNLFFSPYSRQNNHYHESGREVIDASIVPGNHEKIRLLAMFNDMRKDSLFCDIIFVSHGKFFRAHKVIVSSWSRWLRALLTDTSSEYKSSGLDISRKDIDDVVNLDIFDPNALETVLDYMYGVSIEVSVEVTDNPTHKYS